jgi:hypothetical protein
MTGCSIGVMNAHAEVNVRVYRSKRDAWLMVILWATLLGTAAGAVAIMFASGILIGRLLTALFMLASGGFVAWIAFGTRYTLTDRTLLIRSGPFRWTVMLDSITRVTPTHNPLSSPALSLDRLQITYRGAFSNLMISPEPRADFLRDLAARSPSLRLEGDRLVRD